MKRVILSILTITLVISGFAQNFQRPGYLAKSNSFKFNESQTNMPMKGYYILKNGTEHEAIIAYQKPEFMVGDFAAGASLFICKSLTGKAVNVFNPDSEPNYKKYIKKDELRAFFIDGHLYTNYKNVGWRIVLNEGAIHSYINVVKFTSSGKHSYTSFKQTQYFDGKVYGSAFSSISSNNLLTLIKTTPPSVAKGKNTDALVQDYKNNKYSLYQTEVRYNIWFNNNSEQQIDYILGENGLNKKEGDAMAAKDKAIADKKKAEEDLKLQNEANKKKAEEDLKLEKEATKNAVHTPKQDHFKGRSTTVIASVASATPEVKVKKQKFLGRINRIKADGNKVGVIVNCTNTEVNPTSHTFFSRQKKANVKGSYPPVEGIEKIATTTVEELNKSFNTDVFEVIDIKDIPYKDNGKGGKMDDWWATKYKIVIFYNYRSYYVAYEQSNADTTITKKEFIVQRVVKSSVFMTAAEKGKSKMKSVKKGPKSAGTYYSERYVGDKSKSVYTIQELKEFAKPASDEKIVEVLMKEQQRDLSKVIKKNSK